MPISEEIHRHTLKSEIGLDFDHSPFTNVADYILSRAQNVSNNNFCDAECIRNVFNNESYSSSDVQKLAGIVALNLADRGFKKGDTVLYSSHDGGKLHTFLLGVWQVGGIARASYPEDHGEDLLERILESEVKWIFCDEENAQENLKVVSRVSWPIEIIVSGKPSEKCTSIGDFFRIDAHLKDRETVNPQTRLDDTALILQTSGTTGKSKGAVYTHRGLLNNIKLLEKVPFVKNHGEKFLLTSKLTHYTGTVIPLSFISSCKSILIDPKPSLDSILSSISKHEVHGLLAFPKYLLCLANEKELHGSKLKTLKYAVTAGQVVGPSFVSAVKGISSLESLMLVYGMTEVGVLGVSASWSNAKSEVLDEIPEFSCGKLAPGNELQVRDLQTGKLQKAREIGEFYFRSPYSCNGYYNRKEETSKTFDNGWVATGDVGFYDENGFMYLKDRAKEIFKYFNNHICPSELENVLLRHPAVAQAGVIGIPDPDGGDTIPRGFVVMKASNNEDQAEDDIIDNIHKFVNGNVASYKQFRGGIFTLSELPIGKTGKVMRNLLQNISCRLGSG